jgi:hypothetical protein
MNATQVSKLKSLTTRLDRHTRYSDYKPMNGVMVFKVEEDARGVVLVATSEENSWFETRCFLFAAIGPRGGVKVYVNENVPPYVLR